MFSVQDNISASVLFIEKSPLVAPLVKIPVSDWPLPNYIKCFASVKRRRFRCLYVSNKSSIIHFIVTFSDPISPQNVYRSAHKSVTRSRRPHRHLRDHNRRSLQREADRSRRQHELPNDSNYGHVQGRTGGPAGKRLHSRLENQVFDPAGHVEERSDVQKADESRDSGKRKVRNSTGSSEGQRSGGRSSHQRRPRSDFVAESGTGCCGWKGALILPCVARLYIVCKV